MDKHDELTRIAAILEHDGDEHGVCARLRQIAQGAKTGGVPEGWAIRMVDGEVMVSDPGCKIGAMYPSHTARSLSERLLHALASAMLAAPPANPPEAGVTDEMVERADAYWESQVKAASVGTKGWQVTLRDSFNARDLLIAALTAPQPKDAT